MLDSHFIDRLDTFLYKTISVYTVSTNENTLGFTGTLAAVHDDYISLILTIGTVHRQHTPINFNRTYASRNILCQPGSIADIPIDKITAVIHYPT